MISYAWRENNEDITHIPRKVSFLPV